MKILFTAGGTGGHFYPIIAIAEAIREKVKEKKILPPTLYYMAPNKYNPRALFDNDINFVYVPAGKMRRYFSILNITDIFKTITGVIMAIIKMYQVYPDVVFGKGGYASFPALFAAKILKIPVVIHESDSEPGRVNNWAKKFAKKIAISYPEAIKYFDSQKTAHTGNPIRKEIIEPLTEGASEFLKLNSEIPTIFVMGGSQGSKMINDTILDSLLILLPEYQIIHQTGRKNFEEVKNTASLILKDSPYKERYKIFNYLNDLAIRMSAGISSIVVSRAGSTIFEIAGWGKPSIIIPLNEGVSHDQLKNAYSYARSGSAVVIEEHNLTANILKAEIEKIVKNNNISASMSKNALIFAKKDASLKIANALIDIALEHA